MDKAPFLGRAIALAFVWIFVLAAAYVLLDGLDVWNRLPQALTGSIDVATGIILLLALVAHLLLATGPIPPLPSQSEKR
jgi:hypothetical protein